MVNTVDITDDFSEDGEVVFDFQCYDRDGSVLPGAGLATVSMTVTDWRDGSKVFEETGSPELTLVDAGTARFQAKPAALNLALLTPGVTYKYDIWSVTGNEGRLHQLNGLFRLGQATRET